MQGTVEQALIIPPGAFAWLGVVLEVLDDQLINGAGTPAQ